MNDKARTTVRIPSTDRQLLRFMMELGVFPPDVDSVPQAIGYALREYLSDALEQARQREVARQKFLSYGREAGLIQ